MANAPIFMPMTYFCVQTGKTVDETNQPNWKPTSFI
jgi:hypothetical protein